MSSVPLPTKYVHVIFTGKKMKIQNSLFIYQTTSQYEFFFLLPTHCNKLKVEFNEIENSEPERMLKRSFNVDMTHVGYVQE